MATKSDKPNVFTAIKMISSQRPVCYQDIVEANAPYETFMVNRAFSLSEDTVIAANAMNLRGYLDKDAQATYLIHAIRPRHRFEKWPKMESDAEIDIIARYYGMSTREAKLSRGLHTISEVAVMKAVLEEGAHPSRFR